MKGQECRLLEFMEIRNIKLEEFEEVKKVYANARKIMKNSGNLTQWGDNRPSEETLLNDIKNENLYGIFENGELLGAFALIFGEDETYKVIRGHWLNDEPYATIHRIASSGKKNGLMKNILDFCESKSKNIRIDTHEDNLIMQHILSKNGYEKCGIIYVDDGTERIAFQKVVGK